MGVIAVTVLAIPAECMVKRTLPPASTLLSKLVGETLKVIAITDWPTGVIASCCTGYVILDLTIMVSLTL